MPASATVPAAVSARATIANPYNAGEDHDVFAAWLGHVAAGRIGANPPCPPAVAAHRDAQAAQFAAFAADRRRITPRSAREMRA